VGDRGRFRALLVADLALASHIAKARDVAMALQRYWVEGAGSFEKDLARLAGLDASALRPVLDEVERRIAEAGGDAQAALLRRGGLDRSIHVALGRDGAALTRALTDLGAPVRAPLRPVADDRYVAFALPSRGPRRAARAGQPGAGADAASLPPRAGRGGVPVQGVRGLDAGPGRNRPDGPRVAEGSLVRRAGGLWPDVVSFSSLLRAAHRAALGKRTARSVARFLERAEPEVLALQRELEAGTWRPGRAATFEISDPKRRTITAVPFRDQVVHHALMGVLEPVFERRMVFDSYACRRGKGTHAALARARRFVRRFGYFLKLDVKSFFASVPHPAVRETLARVVKDRRVLALCAIVLQGTPGGRSLPVGSLTSQWFANLLLDRLDHYVKEELRIRGYVRYMDDFVLFADARARLRDAHGEVERFLADPLGLRLKPSATILAPTTQGLPFLGWLVYRGVTRVRPRNLRRYRWRLRQRRWEVASGRRSPESYRRGVASVYELLRHGDTAALRRRWND